MNTVNFHKRSYPQTKAHLQLKSVSQHASSSLLSNGEEIKVDGLLGSSSNISGSSLSFLKSSQQIANCLHNSVENWTKSSRGHFLL